MGLWKLLLCLTFLAVVLSDEVPQELSSVEINENDILNMLPGQQDKLMELMKKLATGNELDQVAILNDYADDLLANLNDFIVTNALDPVPMPDIVENFEWKIWPITYRGEMSLTKGWLQGLSTIERRGDVTVEYKYPQIRIRIPMGVNVLMFDYQYKIKFMGLGPSGGLDGKVSSCKWTIDLSLNMVDLRAKMESYKLDSLGKITLKFNGNALLDWMINIFVSVTIPFVTPVVKLVLQIFIKGGVESIFDIYNGAICQVLGDCPEPEAILNMFY